MIQIQVNDTAVQALLSRLQTSVKNLQPAMAEIGNSLQTRIADGFKTSAGPYGKWKSLARSTIMGRLKKNKGNFSKKTGKISAQGRHHASAGFQILVSSGVLRNSITSRASANSVTVGTNTPYAAIHQFGGKAGRGRKVTIPARPFMPIRNGSADLPPAWQAEIIGILQRRIAQAIR